MRYGITCVVSVIVGVIVGAALPDMTWKLIASAAVCRTDENVLANVSANLSSCDCCASCACCAGGACTCDQVCACK